MKERTFKVGATVCGGPAATEGQFRRIKGHCAMPGLIKALEVITCGQPPGSERDVA